MTAGQDLIDTARTFLGEPYSTGPGRADPNSGYKDCSGLIAASYLVATGRPLGADVSVTIYDLCVSQGLWIPFEFAENIAGTCLLMPEDPYQGWGPYGHIGFADGFGGTVEATPPKVQNLSVEYQPWGSNACMLPGIDYDNYGQGSNEEDDDMKGLWIRREDEPFVWLLYGGYRIASGGKGQVDVMQFSSMTHNGWDNVSSISARDFDEIPVLEWRDFPKGRYICGPPE
jgi:hypothetical protein